MNELTLILLTYNRLAYLKKTVQSCIDQTNKKFNLIIVDNSSTDGTDEFLRELKNQYFGNLQIIINPQNMGPQYSSFIALDIVNHKGWVTFVGDDDLLSKDFVDKYYTARNENPNVSCIMFSTSEIDESDKLKSKHINPNFSFLPEEAFCELSTGRIRPAGISGFIFPAKIYEHRTKPIREYPKGYLVDTMLCLLASINNGLSTRSDICYLRRIWSGQVSNISHSSMLDYFQALIMFDNDLREMLLQKKYNNILKLHKIMPLAQFFRIIQFPIITHSYLTAGICLNYLKIAIKYNHRYIPHALIFFILWPFTLKISLPLRIKVNQIRKKFNI
jgi:glycosyltransferase involved in cell wall biosynthesis